MPEVQCAVSKNTVLAHETAPHGLLAPLDTIFHASRNTVLDGVFEVWHRIWREGEHSEDCSLMLDVRPYDTASVGANSMFAQPLGTISRLENPVLLERVI